MNVATGGEILEALAEKTEQGTLTWANVGDEAGKVYWRACVGDSDWSLTYVLGGWHDLLWIEKDLHRVACIRFDERCADVVQALLRFWAAFDRSVSQSPVGVLEAIRSL